MRILHVVSSLDPNDGGPPLVAVRLSAAQALAGHEVHLSYQNFPEAEARIKTAYIAVPGIARITMHSLNTWGVESLTGTVAKPLTKLMPKIDFVHIHGVWEPFLRSTARIARRFDIPYAVRPAGMLEPWSLAQKQFKKRLALMATYRSMLSGAAFIHTLNAEERDLTRKLGIPSPLKVFPNGIFFEEIDPYPSAGSFRCTVPRLGDAPFVLFLGRLHQKKGLDVLADAFTLLARTRSDVHLVVVGPDGGAKADFERRISESNLDARTHVIDGLYGRAKFEAMSDAACFCLPSRQEGFSVAILEALAVGTPVVCTPACHFPEIESCGAGRISELEPNAIADALAYVLEDASRRQNFSDAAKNLVRTHYSWSEICRKIVTAYEEYAHVNGPVPRLVRPTTQSPGSLRVLHVIPSLDPVSGGPPFVALSLAAAQASMGMDAHILSYLFPDSDSRVQEMIRRTPGAEKIKIHYLPPLTGLERVMAWGARRSSRLLADSSDWLHLHGVWDPIIRQMAAVSYALGKPYTIVPHGMLDPWSLQQHAAKKAVALRLGYRAMLNHARFLHVLNADEGRLLEGLSLSTPNVVIPNGIFPEEFRVIPSGNLFRAKFPELARDPYILFLSRLHYKKGLDYLCDAFALLSKELPHVRLVIAGPDFGAREETIARLETHNLSGRAHLVGPVFGEEKISALAGAACFCLSSRQEGFSMAILEALAVGTPVVVSEECHFSELREFNSGLIVSLEPRQIADALKKVLTDPTLASTLAFNGKRLVDAQYTWPAIARQTARAYESFTPPPRTEPSPEMQAV